jgi:hypothetical protein
VLGAAVVAAILFYAVTQSSSAPGDQTPGYITAMLNDSGSLPGEYIPPHPGADGQLCTDVSCLGTSDDRAHFGNGVTRPICTQEQLNSNNIAECYTSNPPTSGPHASSPAQFKVLENPAPKENLLHSMEHGAVVVWYNTQDQTVIDRLTDIVNDELDRRRLLVMSEYTEMEPDTIALTAWSRLDKFPVSELDRDRVEDFIEAHNKRFNPEGF